MKRLIQFTLTFSLIAFLAITSASAQNFGNRTACDMEMKVAWGTPGCVSTGSFYAVVPAFSVVPIPMPPGNVIIAAKGAYIGTSCVFVVGIPCSGYLFDDAVICATACGDYKANLSSWGVVAYQ